jgi:NADPH-dependent glutamate synthase beta subunit-like oxidoreductase
VKLRGKGVRFEGRICKNLRVIEGNCVVLKDDAIKERILISCNGEFIAYWNS